MKIFKYCVLYIAAMAIFFSQVLGVNAGFLSDKLQGTGFISVMIQKQENGAENGATEAVDMIIRPLGEQDAKENVQNVFFPAFIMVWSQMLWAIGSSVALSLEGDG
ncbi:hypothetical protein CEV08_07650 [Bartonella tribocorum]|uniref:Uncharacterized protein n=2 Tax=Bartonella tribocorum TaxID=85701 RepID=A0A2M6UQZ7_9HYPH|nr:hypothetical protein CEV08_07650 [Bartonella tribocorum]